MLLLDQAKILQAMDALVTLSEFVSQEADKSADDERYLPSDQDEIDP